MDTYLIPIVAFLISACTVFLSVRFGKRNIDIAYVDKLRLRVLTLQSTLKIYRLNEVKLQTEIDQLKEHNLELHKALESRK